MRDVYGFYDHQVWHELLPVAAKTLIAEHAPLVDLLWFYDELACSKVDQVILRRLNSGEYLSESPTHQRASFGKLLEHLLHLRDEKAPFVDKLLPHAESRLLALRAQQGGFRHEDVAQNKLRVAVLGDASGSMDVSIRVASTLASLLQATYSQAELLFFSARARQPPGGCMPKTAAEVLQVAETVRARGSTCMAAALYPFYRQRKPLDLVVMVTDEEETEAYHGWDFVDLFAAYRLRVAPQCRLMLVSFLPPGDRFPGRIRSQLERAKLWQPGMVYQFRLNDRRPDTSRFDALLAKLRVMMMPLRYRYTHVLETLDEAIPALPQTIAMLIHDYGVA